VRAHQVEATSVRRDARFEKGRAAEIQLRPIDLS